MPFMKPRLRMLPLVFLLLATGLWTSGYENKQNMKNIADLSLDDLLAQKISVATKTEISTREVPGIVNLITREDILNSGARDLLDVLTLLVPGFHFALDQEGLVGIGVRGMWSNEGKVLLMIDGQEANESQFGSIQFGNHYPVENIERLEIIRGPGSAIYGGYAGVGVINIITRGPEMNGGYLSILNSWMSGDFSHRNFSAGLGKEFKNGGVSFTGTFGQGNRSSGEMTDYFGDRRSMKDGSGLDITNVNFSLKYRGFEFRSIADRYHQTQFDLWGANYPGKPLKEEYDSYFLDVKYSLNLGQAVTLTPEFKFKRQYSWQVDIPDLAYSNQKHSDKSEFVLTGCWSMSKKTGLTFGLEYFNDSLKMPDRPSPYEEKFNNGLNVLTNSNISAFGQLIWRNEIVNLVVGGRFDHSGQFGSAFVPRAGVTKVWGKFHFKGMAGQSFRTPGGILPNRLPAEADKVNPEKAMNYEVEFGCKFTSRLYGVINAYCINFDKVIVYMSDPQTGQGRYYNAGRLGSRGLETEFRYQHDRFSLRANYAYYHGNETTVDSYLVPGREGLFLAFPAHRLNALGNFRLTSKISFNPSLSLYGTRYGYTRFDAGAQAGILTKFEPAAVLNLHLRFKDLPAGGVELDAGVQDVANASFNYIQTYRGGHAPLPGSGRCLVFRLAFTGKFK